MNAKQNYRARSERYARELQKLQPLFRLTAPYRLLTFVATIILLLFFIKSKMDPVFLYAAAATVNLFIRLVRWDLYLVTRQKDLQTCLQMKRDKLRCLYHVLVHLYAGSELSSIHPEL